MSTVAPLNRSLNQELLALLRGVSLECLVCGEFLLRMGGEAIFCPECRSGIERRAAAGARQASGVQGQPAG